MKSLPELRKALRFINGCPSLLLSKVGPRESKLLLIKERQIYAKRQSSVV